MAKYKIQLKRDGNYDVSVVLKSGPLVVFRGVRKRVPPDGLQRAVVGLADDVRAERIDRGMV